VLWQQVLTALFVTGVTSFITGWPPPSNGADFMHQKYDLQALREYCGSAAMDHYR
jgi:hypothetical protein